MTPTPLAGIPPKLAARMAIWGEPKTRALLRRAGILGDTTTPPPHTSLRIASALITLVETGWLIWAADYLARPYLVEATKTPRDDRTPDGFVEAARVFRGLDELAALALLDFATGNVPLACAYLRRVGTDRINITWDGTTWRTKATGGHIGGPDAAQRHTVTE
jgi:hypothetical protein